MEPDNGIPRHQGPQAAGPAPEFLEILGVQWADGNQSVESEGKLQINQGWDGDDWDCDSLLSFLMISLYDQVLSLL